MTVLVLLAFVIGSLVIAVIALALGLAVRGRRDRRSASSATLRAGEPAGESDPRKAYERAQGRSAWTRMSGGI